MRTSACARLRSWRDTAFGLASAPIGETTIGGIRLSLRGLSPKMRYIVLRGYEAEEAGLALRHIKPGDRIIELGSSLGFMALTCMKKIGVRDYCMVEASPHLPKMIERNFRLNGIPMPPLLNVAAAARPGTLSFGINRDSWSSSALARDNEKDRIEVPAMDIPAMFAKIPFRPDTLISDIEGAETELPLEHYGLFSKILIETHPHLSGAERTWALVSGLGELGFRAVDRVEGTYFFQK